MMFAIVARCISTHLEKRFCMVSNYVFPLAEHRSGPTKSIQVYCHEWLIAIGWRMPNGLSCKTL